MQFPRDAKNQSKEPADFCHKRAKFLRIYAGVPDELRADILVVVDQKTYTWNTAFLAVKNNTPLGEKILKILEEIGVL